MHRLHLLSSRTALTLAIAAALSGTAAFGWFSAGGAGAGQASVGTAQAVTITAVTPSTGLLYPGADGGVDATLRNPNTVPVRIGSLTLDSSRGTNGFAADPAHSACDVSALSYTTQTAGWTVPARAGTTDGTLVVHLAGAIHMSAAASNACQGATFTVGLAAGS